MKNLFYSRYFALLVILLPVNLFNCTHALGQWPEPVNAGACDSKPFVSPPQTISIEVSGPHRYMYLCKIILPAHPSPDDFVEIFTRGTVGQLFVSPYQGNRLIDFRPAALNSDGRFDAYKITFRFSSDINAWYLEGPHPAEFDDSKE